MDTRICDWQTGCGYVLDFYGYHDYGRERSRSRLITRRRQRRKW